MLALDCLHLNWHLYMYVLKKYTFVTHITKIIDNYYYENKLVSIFIMMNIGLKI